MARKRTVTVTREEGDELDLPNKNPDAEQDGETDALYALKLIGGDEQLRYNVFKVSGKQGAQTGFCQTYDVETFSPEAVRETWGGGKYQVRVTDSHGKVIKKATFEVMEPIHKPGPAQPSTLADSIAGVKPLLDLIHPPQAGSSNEILIAFMKSQSDILQAILNKPAPPPSPPPQQLGLADILALLAAMKPAKEVDPVASLMDGLKLGRELAGEGGGETGMLDVAAKGFEMIGQLAKTPTPSPQRPRIAARVTPVQTADPQIGTTPAQPAPSAAPVTQPATGADVSTKLLRQLDWLRRQLATLIYQAQRNADPALYAEVMLDNLPPFISEEDINARINEPGSVTALAQIDGRVAQHREWFEKFRLAVIEIMSDDGEGESEEGPPGGEIDGDDGMDGLGDA